MGIGYNAYEFKESDAWDFARFLGSEVKERGRELTFRTCPYCHGGDRGKDKDTFSINLDNGAHLCLRSTCNAHGNMITLARDFGFKLAGLEERPVKKYRTFKTPDKPLIPKPAAIAYLESRGISEEIGKKYEITVKNGQDNVLVFPFYDEQGKLQFIKYRKTDFDKTKDKNKEWCEKDGKPILFGMKQCDDGEVLIITEGQIDSLSVAEAGFANAVSVPTGAKGFTWIPNCWEFVNRFNELVIFGDYEKGKITLLDELSRKFTCQVKHVREEDYKDCKDANDILRKYGKEQIVKCITNAIYVPVQRVISLAEVETVNPFDIEKLKTGIHEVDSLLRGGLPFGNYHIIGGKRGDGKLLANDTPVYTADGWKNHGDLIVGDKVIGADGKFVKVTHVFPKHYANMKVTLSNGEEIYCHENHEWVVTVHSGKTYKTKILTARDIYEKKHNGYTHPIRLIDRKPLDGEKTELYVKPYTLGAWLGDGRRDHPDICSSKQDICVVESIVNDDGYEITWQTEHKGTGVLYFGFKGLREQLKKYDMCVSRKSLPKHIPQEYIKASLHDKLELLAGLLDTDGYYDHKKQSYTFTTTDEELRDSFLDLIHSMGWTSWTRSQEPRVTTSGVCGKKVIYHIGFNAKGVTIPCRVQRKRQDVVKDYSHGHVTIRSIEYCEHKQGNCIEVDGGIYCVGKTMIPTHNSTWASQIIGEAIDQGFKVFVYSGELTLGNFRAWLDFQIAGSQNIIENVRDGIKTWFVTNSTRDKIGEWYEDKCYIYDNTKISDEHEELLKTIEEVIRKYGVRVILIDNLMTAIDIDTDIKTSEYDQQAGFAKKIAEIAMKYNVCILLVAHRRKQSSFNMDMNDEISGSSKITNLAGVVLGYDRPTKKEIEDSQGEITELDRKITVTKNRLFGRLNYAGYVVKFDEKSKRIYGNGDNPNKHYGWETGKQDYSVMDADIPFE